LTANFIIIIIVTHISISVQSRRKKSSKPKACYNNTEASAYNFTILLCDSFSSMLRHTFYCPSIAIVYLFIVQYIFDHQFATSYSYSDAPVAKAPKIPKVSKEPKTTKPKASGLTTAMMHMIMFYSVTILNRYFYRNINELVEQCILAYCNIHV
jgi:hypothetical protein